MVPQLRSTPRLKKRVTENQLQILPVAALAEVDGIYIVLNRRDTQDCLSPCVSVSFSLAAHLSLMSSYLKGNLFGPENLEISSLWGGNTSRFRESEGGTPERSLKGP